MRLATPSSPSIFIIPAAHQRLLISKTSSATADSPNSAKSMSQGLHPGILSFSNGFDRPTTHQEEQHRQHVAQQSRRDKLRVQGFEHSHQHLVAIEEESSVDLPVYETGAMWSEMFNFPAGATAAATGLLDNEIPSNYGLSRTPTPASAMGNEWYGNRQGMVGSLGPLGDSKHSNSDNRDSIAQNHQISSINADSAAAMQLFLMNPQPRSPSPPPPPSTSSTPLHLLLSNQSATSNPSVQGYHSVGAAAFGSSQISPSPFTLVSSTSNTGGDDAAIQLNSSSKIGGVAESQGLSLTLSSSLQHLEAAKAEEFRMGDDGVFYYGSRGSGAAPTSFQLKNLGSHQSSLHMQAMGQNDHIGFRASSTLGMINLLRNSRYVKAARELLEEFCSVGRGDLKNKKPGRHNTNLQSPNHNGGSSSSSKDLPPLSAADRIDYQRKKTKLLSMLDEVDRRYNHYCEQMQAVVNSFDSVMGFGAATPYTGLAQKAMSRHFRCLKDAIVAQLKLTCELLGEKDTAGASGVTKGETPRLRLLEQSLRQQRVFHQMGMMEQEAWRPQRGLPERSVNILRAWLFEHFLHPYPSDADKHLLSRQTGLSRNQVSNWFINARVRLWKPMIEEMYQKESKAEGADQREEEEEADMDGDVQSKNSARTPTPTEAVTAAATTTTTTESDPSLHALINRQCFSESQAIQASSTTSPTTATTATAAAAARITRVAGHDVLSPVTLESADVHQMAAVDHVLDDTCLDGSMVAPDYRTTSLPNPNNNTSASSLVNFRTTTTTTGDHVSLTLGLRHAGNLPEKNRFSLRDFGGC